jgi:hypothetical protein
MLDYQSKDFDPKRERERERERETLRPGSKKEDGS